MPAWQDWLVLYFIEGYWMRPDEYQKKVGLTLEMLGISRSIIEQKNLRFQLEPQDLVIAESNAGFAHRLVPRAAQAWRAMKVGAAQDGIVLEIVSAFRSIEEQADIIRDKLGQGLAMEAILALSAPPGYSEHHSGCAIDINTPGCLEREEVFEQTDAFFWLMENASHHGYTLSYPRGNSAGFIYEPWHWLYRDTKV